MDEFSFELGEKREDIEDEPATLGTSVDVLLQRFELDPSLLQCIHVVYQVANGATEAVEPPDH